VAIVVYASSNGTALDPTRGDRKAEILGVIDSLAPGGSTHGSAGIEAAYEMAVRNFIPDGTNRVILCTDGDFNVGITDDGSLERFIADKAAQSKVFLTVLGFGTGNTQDAKMEGLADKGNGNYHYIDAPREAHKVLVEEIGQTLVTIAKDVKIQVDFNPAKVEAYRLVGYENRMLAAQDFKDDRKDAGEIGAGHTVTALYELVPPGAPVQMAGVEPSKFTKPAEPAAAPDADAATESFEVRLRFKPPTGDVSTERKFPIVDDGKDYAEASPDTKWAASVAAFGMILRESPYKGTATFEGVAEQAGAAKGDDPGGYRAEFIEMVEKARTLSPPPLLAAPAP
jgi:Ca-activated chloride channel family protein